ncbi:DUF1376 domain-containing protein [Rhodoferax sp. GW822-FHT02A01]|uniref:DUF1376 domain-containing protein n=1 Tax=Rhodoferax sp. GW822-FHT02A01 TaxID=3141537 RepID=UPI00315DA376
MTLPGPLTPPDCDLSDFQYMELDVRRLRDSHFAAQPNGEAFRAGVLLWCAAWHQVPAASLPDDDVELSNLAGFGRVVREWKKVRTEALAGFVKCSDGRLYHAVIAEKALAAHASKERYAYGKFLERMRKENVKRAKESKPEFGIPTQEQWKSGAYPHGIPPVVEQIPTENAHSSTGNDAENALRGNREGEGTEINTVTYVTDGGAVKTPADMTKVELWRVGKSLLNESGMPMAQCGSFVGKLCKDYGDDIVIEAVRATCVAQPADPAEYLKATCMRIKGTRATANRQTALEDRNQQVGDSWANGDSHATQ